MLKTLRCSSKIYICPAQWRPLSLEEKEKKNLKIYSTNACQALTMILGTGFKLYECSSEQNRPKHLHSWNLYKKGNKKAKCIVTIGDRYYKKLGTGTIKKVGSRSRECWRDAEEEGVTIFSRLSVSEKQWCGYLGKESSKQRTSSAKALQRKHDRSFLEQQGGWCGWAERVAGGEVREVIGRLGRGQIII